MKLINIVSVLGLIITICFSLVIHHKYSMAKIVNDDLEIIKRVNPNISVKNNYLNGIWYQNIENIGSIAAIHEHDCCSGRGVILVLLKVHQGKIYRSDENYCVIKSLMEEIDLEIFRDYNEFEEYLISKKFYIFDPDKI